MKSILLSALLYLGTLFGVYNQGAGPAVHTNGQTSSSTQPTAFIPDDERFPPIITYPLGSDVLRAGQTYNITWNNENPNVIAYTLNLEYVTDGGVYIGQIIGAATSTAQSFAFKVPSNIMPRTNYQIYFINSANKHILVGTQAFTIK